MLAMTACRRRRRGMLQAASLLTLGAIVVQILSPSRVAGPLVRPASTLRSLASCGRRRGVAALSVFQSPRRRAVRSILGSTLLVSHQLRPSIAGERLSGDGGRMADIDRKKLYDNVADKYDELDGGAAATALGLPEKRAKLLAEASGDVLELAVGTGLNLPLYRYENIKSLRGVDLSSGMLQNAVVKKNKLPARDKAKISLSEMDASRLSFDDNSFDYVVETFSLCVVYNPEAVLREAFRVLKPGGQLLILENSRSTNPILGLYQDVTADILARYGGKACIWNQDVIELTKNVGFKLDYVEDYGTGLLRAVKATKQV